MVSLWHPHFKINRRYGDSCKNTISCKYQFKPCNEEGSTRLCLSCMPRQGKMRHLSWVWRAFQELKYVLLLQFSGIVFKVWFQMNPLRSLKEILIGQILDSHNSRCERAELTSDFFCLEKKSHAEKTGWERTRIVWPNMRLDWPVDRLFSGIFKKLCRRDCAICSLPQGSLSTRGIN